MFAALEASGDVYGTTRHKAVETVFFAILQEASAEVSFGIKAIERELLSIDNLRAAATRLGLSGEKLLSESLSYVEEVAGSNPASPTKENRLDNRKILQ